MEYANKPDFRLIPVKTFLEKLRLILIKTSGDKISLLRTERLIYIDDDLIRSLPILKVIIFFLAVSFLGTQRRNNLEMN